MPAHASSSPGLIARFRAARTDPTLAVLEGFHAVKHAIRFGATIDLLMLRDLDSARDLAHRLAPDVAGAIDLRGEAVEPALFDQLSPTPPETGIIAIAQRRMLDTSTLAALPASAPLVFLESPSHSGNIGAAVRVAAAAGAAALITSGPVDPWNPGALRGSAGLHYAIPVGRIAIADLPDRPIVAVDPDGTELGEAPFPRAAILAFGSERAGVSPELLARAAHRTRIPMRPGVSSLNLATAVAVMLYCRPRGE